ncbi:DUF2982 domain-containing protein [Vibrio anguillarum]|uniref:DUF2982 domain-containing protein n=1 Tax=Vibrio anguillarum TaxID=55601 RepID=UPI0018FE89B9|nr:DUF2982 domain-containing protein [Vibrio anguillarum]MBF4423064.1 DUF2982 domain-containing protein [Vibrio anguillarum]
MHTQHLSNTRFSLQSPVVKWINTTCIIASICIVIFSSNIIHALLLVSALAVTLITFYFLILKGKVSYTLTATHFQQHLFKGGWVVKWNNISRIGVCSYEYHGWHQPLPWIGIKLKDYSLYLESVCPRIASEILLSQRALLYLGAKQQRKETQFEDLVLDNAPYTAPNGNYYHGLMAMLANRMRYQRQFFDYDIFISAHDLDRDAEAFVGLIRRYLAAAEPD